MHKTAHTGQQNYGKLIVKADRLDQMSNQILTSRQTNTYDRSLLVIKLIILAVAAALAAIGLSSHSYANIV